MMAEMTDIDGKMGPVTATENVDADLPCFRLKGERISASEAAQRTQRAALKERVDTIAGQHDHLTELAIEPVLTERDRVIAATEQMKAHLQAIIHRDPSSLAAELAKLEMANLMEHHRVALLAFDKLGFSKKLDINKSRDQAIARAQQQLNMANQRSSFLSNILSAMGSAIPKGPTIHDRLRNSLDAPVAISEAYKNGVKSVSDPASSVLNRIDWVAKLSSEAKRIADEQPGQLASKVQNQAIINLAHDQVEYIEADTKLLASAADKMGVNFSPEKVVEQMQKATASLAAEVSDHADAAHMARVHADIQKAMQQLLMTLKNMFARLFGCLEHSVEAEYEPTP